MSQDIPQDSGWLQVIDSKHDVILWSKHQLVNGTVSTSYGNFINDDLPAGKQLRIQPLSGTSVTITLNSECIERK